MYWYRNRENAERLYVNMVSVNRTTRTLSELFRKALWLNYLEKPSEFECCMRVALGSASPRRSFAEIETAPGMIGGRDVLLHDGLSAATVFVFHLNYRFCFWSFR